MNKLWILALVASMLVGDLCHSQEHYVAPNCLKSASTGNIYTYPWFLAFHYDGHYRCGAEVIANDMLLTSAHCVLSLRKDLIRVYLTDGTLRKVTDVIIHEAYNAHDNTHDVALMRLGNKIVFNQHLSPACLPTNKQEPAGKDARVLGWRFPMSHHRFPESLLLVNVSIYSNPECSRMRYKPAAITNYMTCAGNVNRDICSPDISGPLIVQHDQRWELVGIKSWNEHCGRAGYPQVYTKLLYYVDWICNQMRHWKVEHVECHCSVTPAANCPACGIGYIGRIEEIDTDCVTIGNMPDKFVFRD